MIILPGVLRINGNPIQTGIDRGNITIEHYKDIDPMEAREKNIFLLFKVRYYLSLQVKCENLGKLESKTTCTAKTWSFGF